MDRDCGLKTKADKNQMLGPCLTKIFIQLFWLSLEPTWTLQLVVVLSVARVYFALCSRLSAFLTLLL